MSKCCGGGAAQQKEQQTQQLCTTNKQQERQTIDVTQRAKIVFLGDAGVGTNKLDNTKTTGKTSIVNRFVKNEFHNSELPTIGAAFAAQSYTVKGTDKTVRFELWDTAGQERYHSLAPMYYRGCLAAVVVYDLTSYSTFEKAKEWFKELKRNCQSVLVLQLVGSKLDLESQQLREVSNEEAAKYARDNQFSFIEVSAKTGENIEELFENVAKLLIERTATPQ